MTCTARYGEELSPERRLGLQVLRDGQVVAVAWRTIVAVATPPTVAGATVPDVATSPCSTSTRCVGDQPPDLVVSVCRADAGSSTLRLDGVRRRPGRAGPRPAEHQHPRGRHRRVRDRDPAVDPVLRRPGQGLPRPGGPGRSASAGRSRRACRTRCAPSSGPPGGPRAPAVLLLTEELTVPWELAAPSTPTDEHLGRDVAVPRGPRRRSRAGR